MEPFRARSTGEQVTEHLRGQILRGVFSDTMPGIKKLVGALGVNSRAVEAAMRRLTKEGLLEAQGPGKRRRILLSVGDCLPRHFRVRILGYEPADRSSPHSIDLLDQLHTGGFSADFATKSLLELGMDVKRVARFVRGVPADAWIVDAGSREVLEWFCHQPLPAYALFGVKSGLPIAGTAVRKDLRPLIRRLVQMGHRRIVLLSREDRVKPKPALFEQTFLDTLQSEGIAPGVYHLPVWGCQPEGLHRCLESLLKVSPPTVLIVNEVPIFWAVRDHLASCGLIAPRDISLISLDHDPSLSWCDPVVTHFSWDLSAVARRAVAWAHHVARGKEDLRQTFVPARFVEGGTIGSVAPER